MASCNNFKLILLLFFAIAFGCAKVTGSAHGPVFEPLVQYPAQYTTVTIYRPYQSKGSGGAPYIYINDKRVALLRNQSFTRIYLKPGEYTLDIKKSPYYNSRESRSQFTILENRQQMFLRIAEDGEGEIVGLVIEAVISAALKTTPALSAHEGVRLYFMREEYALKEIGGCKFIDPEEYNLIAVLDVDLNGAVDPSVSLSLADQLRQSIAESGRYAVLDSNTTHSLLKEQTPPTNVKLYTERIIETGRLMGVGKVLASLVNSTDDGYLMTLALINVQTGKVEKMQDRVCKSRMSTLSEAGKAAAKELIEPDKAPGPQAAIEAHQTATSAMLSPGTYQDPVTGMEFVLLKGGCYTMGDSTKTKAGHEKPFHEVCIDDLYVGKYEVTQGQWKTIMGNNTSANQKGDTYPVENVNWDEVQAFILNLKQKAGKLYRLPTEAEWEFAAKCGGENEKWAGTSTPTELTEYAWFRGNTSKENGTHPVGQKKSNGCGLYDMSGNVKEWVNDLYSSTYYLNSPRNNPTGPLEGDRRVLRGGYWNSNPDSMFVTSRATDKQANRNKSYGFRLVLQVK